MRGGRQTDASTVTIAARGALAEPCGRAELIALMGATPRMTRAHHGDRQRDPRLVQRRRPLPRRRRRDRARTAAARRRAPTSARRRRRVDAARSRARRRAKSSSSACCPSCARSPTPASVVSIDTMNASTAVAAVEAGARIVNDVSGGMADPDMLAAVAGHGGRHRAQPLARTLAPTCTPARSTPTSSPRCCAELQAARRCRRGRGHRAVAHHRRPGHRVRQAGRAELGRRCAGSTRIARARAPGARRHESQAIPRRDARAGCRGRRRRPSAAISRPP